LKRRVRDDQTAWQKRGGLPGKGTSSFSTREEKKKGDAQIPVGENAGPPGPSGGKQVGSPRIEKVRVYLTWQRGEDMRGRDRVRVKPGGRETLVSRVLRESSNSCIVLELLIEVGRKARKKRRLRSAQSKKS